MVRTFVSTRVDFSSTGDDMMSLTGCLSFKIKKDLWLEIYGLSMLEQRNDC